MLSVLLTFTVAIAVNPFNSFSLKNAPDRSAKIRMEEHEIAFTFNENYFR